LEDWNNGILGKSKTLEYWKDGMLEYWVKRKNRKNGEKKRNGSSFIFLTHHSILPLFQYSGILSSHYSTIPSFQSFSHPSFHHSSIPSFQYCLGGELLREKSDAESS
jgi:hypothetical protein